jgi:hypothetical protein
MSGGLEKPTTLDNLRAGDTPILFTFYGSSRRLNFDAAR